MFFCDTDAFGVRQLPAMLELSSPLGNTSRRSGNRRRRLLCLTRRFVQEVIHKGCPHRGAGGVKPNLNEGKIDQGSGVSVQADVRI